MFAADDHVAFGVTGQLGEGARGLGHVFGDEFAVEIGCLADIAHAVGGQDTFRFGMVEVNTNVGQEFQRGAVDEIERLFGGQLIHRQPVDGLRDTGDGFDFGVARFPGPPPACPALSSLAHRFCLLEQEGLTQRTQRAP